MEVPSLILWVRPEPFDYGAIHTPLPSKLTLHNLHKLSIYSRSKGKAGYPRLSYSLWKHVACFKLGMSEEHAWMYFETFDMLCEPSFKDSNAWIRQYPLCKTPEELENLRCMTSVCTLQFLLFLFIQQIYNISFKASLVSGGEEWPTHSRSPELHVDHKGSFAIKSLDEHEYMMFILHHLNEILELLMEPESNLSGTTTESCLTLEAVDALGFLFSGTVDGKKSQPLEELARLQPEANKSGYSKISRTFSFRHFQSWLQSHLNISPFGVSAILSHGTKAKDILSLSDSFDDHGRHADSKDHSLKGKIMSNVIYAALKQKLVIMSQVCKQTVAKASDIYSGSDVKIHRCHYSYIYILCPLRSVTIQRCHNSTIVLGCVKTVVNIIGCENVTFTMICNRVAISGCVQCTFHLCCSTQPLILLGNENLTLAPYHTFYPKLEEHLKSQWGVTTKPNKWNEPLILGNGHPECLDGHTPPNVYRELPVQDFFTFNIPFSMKGSTDASPIPLPVKYEEALQERENTINSWYEMVKNSSLAKPQRQQLQNVVQNRFQDWLAESGEASQLNGLVPSHSPKHTQEANKH